MKSMDLIIFFWDNFGGTFHWNQLVSESWFPPMILGRICHNGLQHFMVNFSRKTPSRQADRCWFLPLIPQIQGVWPSIMMTIVDWVMTLGFLGKKGVWKKKFMAKILQKVPSYGVSWLFSQQFFKIQVLDLHAIGMRLSCSTIGPAGRGIWWDLSLKGIDWGR